MNDRIAKLNSLVQQEVAGILSREVEFPRSFFVTVTRAEVADDAESAKVWVSVLPANAEQSALEIIQKRIADVQSILNKRLVMKFVPKLTFLLDHSEERATYMSQVLDSMTSNDLGLEIDEQKAKDEQDERDKQKEARGLQPGQALNPRKPRR